MKTSLSFKIRDGLGILDAYVCNFVTLLVLIQFQGYGINYGLKTCDWAIRQHYT